jgi:hypothetical protein
MRALVAGLAIALLATPALAQGHQRGGGGGKPEQREQAAAQKRKADEIDKAYRAGLNKIPDANVKQDPWAGVRGGDAGNTTSKSK